MTSSSSAVKELWPELEWIQDAGFAKKSSELGCALLSEPADPG